MLTPRALRLVCCTSSRRTPLIFGRSALSRLIALPLRGADALGLHERAEIVLQAELEGVIERDGDDGARAGTGGRAALIRTVDNYVLLMRLTLFVPPALTVDWLVLTLPDSPERPESGNWRAELEPVPDCCTGAWGSAGTANITPSRKAGQFFHSAEMSLKLIVRVVLALPQKRCAILSRIFNVRQKNERLLSFGGCR